MIFSLKTTTLVVQAQMTDISALAEIHHRCFSRGWSESEFRTLLSDNQVRCLILKRSNLRVREEPVGFVLTRSVLDEAEILTIAISPDYRGFGGGRALMEELLRSLYGDRVAKLFLEVDGSNEPALSLYRSLGFEKVGERKGYYQSGGENASTAFIMQLGVSGR